MRFTQQIRTAKQHIVRLSLGAGIEHRQLFVLLSLESGPFSLPTYCICFGGILFNACLDSRVFVRWVLPSRAHGGLFYFILSEWTKLLTNGLVAKKGKAATQTNKTDRNLFFFLYIKQIETSVCAGRRIGTRRITRVWLRLQSI